MKIIKMIFKFIMVLAFLPLGVAGLIMTITDFDGVNLALTIIGLIIGIPSLISFIRDYKSRSKPVTDNKNNVFHNIAAVNDSKFETKPNPNVPSVNVISVKSLDGGEPQYIPYNTVANATPIKGAIKTEPRTMPENVSGIPLAYHYKSVDVCIIRDKKPDFNKLEQYLPVTFIPEPSNPYDSNAVIVRSGKIDIGYLYRGNLQQMMLDYLRMGYPVSSYITSVDGTNEKVNITIGFYNINSGRNYDDFNKLVDKGAAYKSFKLTGNRNSDMQETLADCDESDEIEYEFDDEKGKYVAICGDEIGYFPKSANKYLEEEHPAFIESIEEDENDKYVVTVAVFYEDN